MALNANPAVLHYQNQERAAPSELRSFLIDADAQFDGYAADVTRTYSQGQDDFASMIAAMNKAQLALCSQVRGPGVDYAAIHLDAHQQSIARTPSRRICRGRHSRTEALWRGGTPSKGHKPLLA